MLLFTITVKLHLAKIWPQSSGLNQETHVVKCEGVVLWEVYEVLSAQTPPI